MSRVAQDFFSNVVLGNSQAARLYRSPSEWAESRDACSSAHFMRRAWERMQLEAILTVEGRPTVYFKRLTKKDLHAEAECQKLLWNQGVATLLVVRDPGEVRVYSGLSLPSANLIREQDDTRLVELLDYTAFANKLHEFICRVQTGQLYRDNPTNFSSKVSVDQTLLRNLGAASERLCSGPNGLRRPAAHSLLGRLLFTCYLRDRRVIGDDYLRSVGFSKPGSIRDLLNQYPSGRARDVLFRLFGQLQKDFNGSLFGDELQKQHRQVKATHVEVLKRLLNGEELDKGQLALGFPLYDFRLIPIETISAIYENFLKAESEDQQERSGSFYTPRHLAEMAVDIAVEGWDTLLDKRCLDPACGSGIFLVILFNRMAEEWRFRNPRAQNRTRARKLRDILTSNLYGVDLNETACRITCFSLYLAFLDQLEPRDIWELKADLETEKSKVLPPLLALPDEHYANTRTPRIFATNFFDNSLDQPRRELDLFEQAQPLSRDFDLVIGNPPWVGRIQKRDAVMEEWLFSANNPYVALSPGRAQSQRSLFLPQNQTAHAFMWKAPLHLRREGRACLVLPSKVLLNETDAFQRTWLPRFQVERVVQLADWRRIVFENAVCPATVIVFNPQPPELKQAILNYDVPKVAREDPRQALITVLPEDRKAIVLRDVLSHAERDCASIFWKQSLWGSSRDLQLIERLRRMPVLGDLAGEPRDDKRWIKGQGFQPNTSGKSPKPQPPFWHASDRFIRARSGSLDLFILSSDCVPIGNRFPSLHRPRDPKIYQPPLVLVSQGIGRQFIKCAFCDFPVLFQDSLQSIAGPCEDEDLLLFLTGILNSHLAIYFFFHTAANWGVERDKVHFFELLRLPFPLPEQAPNPKRAPDIVKQVANRIKQARRHAERNLLARDSEVAAAKAEINHLVNEYYGLANWEQTLVEDTVNIFEPSSTPSSVDAEIPTLAPTSERDRAAYAQLLCDTINRWARRSGVRLSARGCISGRIGLGLLTLSKGETTQPYEEREAPEAVAKALDAIQKSLASERQRIAYLRGFTLFEKDKAQILKPLAQRHWTRTAALNDADELVGAFMAGQS